MEYKEIKMEADLTEVPDGPMSAHISPGSKCRFMFLSR